MKKIICCFCLGLTFLLTVPSTLASSAAFPGAPATMAQSSADIQTLTSALLMAFQNPAMVGRSQICKIVAGLPSSARNINDLILGFDNHAVSKALLKQALSAQLFCDEKFPLKPEEAALGPLEKTRSLIDLRSRIQSISDLNAKLKGKL